MENRFEDLLLDDDPEDLENELLDQLQELHRQLAAVRDEGEDADHGSLFASTSDSAFSSNKIVSENNKVIVCSMGRCVRMEKNNDSWQYYPSNGGFKAAIDSLAKDNKVQWVSWPGSVVDEASHEGVAKKLGADFDCKPVFLSNDTLDLFHHKFCNVILWPLMHCLPHRSDIGLLDNFMEQYNAYCTANQQFLETLSEVYNEGDLVLVSDYQLMLLPGLLRRRYPEIVCGFFLNCPFPSSEFYRMLPVRQSLLHGMLGADLVVFNHFDNVRHFLNVCTQTLGLESSPSRIEYNGRLVSLGICPMGINPRKFVITKTIENEIQSLRQQYKDQKIIVSVDKLDFCKGIPEKLASLEFLLENYPKWRGKVVLFAIVNDTGRTSAYQYRMLNRRINEMIGKVNGRYATAEYLPVVYLKNSIDRKMLTALYNLADVALISSLKEGINLQAMEFIASQNAKECGVLVYSEFAGCASSFKGAIIVNPFDTEKLASSIDLALTMKVPEKQIRHHQLSRYVNTYTSRLWGSRILTALKTADVTSREYNVVNMLDSSQLLSYYERSQRRLFLLDYDGTLVPYQSLTQLAAPSSALIHCLIQLCNDPYNSVYVISGRDKSILQGWFEKVPRLGIAAENGYWLRLAKPPASDADDEAEPISAHDEVHDTISANPWQCHEHNIDLQWTEEVESILNHFTQRTPGSLLEKKDSSFTWHFKDADPGFGLTQAKDMQLHLDQMLQQRPVGVVMAPVQRYVVVHPSRLTKGRAVSRIINFESPSKYASPGDFGLIVAMGDERTDEEMFDVAAGNNSFTVTVGKKVSRAQYYVDGEEDILRVLTACSAVNKAKSDEF